MQVELIYKVHVCHFYIAFTSNIDWFMWQVRHMEYNHQTIVGGFKEDNATCTPYQHSHWRPLPDKGHTSRGQIILNIKYLWWWIENVEWTTEKVIIWRHRSRMVRWLDLVWDIHLVSFQVGDWVHAWLHSSYTWMDKTITCTSCKHSTIGLGTLCSTRAL